MALKFFSKLVLFSLLSNVAMSTKIEYSAKKLYFPHQLVDHFDALNSRRWNQTYWIHAPMTNIVSDVPVLFFGGEGLEYDEFQYIHQLLPGFPAVVFTLAHRYYEKGRNVNPTYPFKAARDSRLFTSKQALADAAYFVKKVILGLTGFKKLPIVTGCSYPGSLATWFRLRYPHLSTGAISVSGPLRAEIIYETSRELQQSGLMKANIEYWRWQACTEFGWYFDCLTEWNISQIERQTLIDQTNILYGGINITTLTNTLILNGQQDQNYAQFGMPNYGNNYTGLFSRIIPKCDHCLQGCPEKNYEEAKKYAKEAVMTWIK